MHALELGLDSALDGGDQLLRELCPGAARLRRADDATREAVKAEMLELARGPQGGRVRDTLESMARGELLEVQWEIEEVVEAYLIQLGLLARTARGRCLNGRGWTHLGLPVPANSQDGLFDA